jgi:hypothetical protein
MKNIVYATLPATISLWLLLLLVSCEGHPVKGKVVSGGCVRACVYNATTLGKDKYGRGTASVNGRQASLCALKCVDSE